MSQGLGTERPVTPLPAFDAIPRVLTQEHAGVAWRWEWREQPGKPGRWDKPPYILATDGPDAGRHASSTDPATWRPFEDALVLYDSGRWDGIGIVLVAGLACVDLDNVRDPVSGTVHPVARDVVEQLGGYCEVSPSGRGLHVFCRGTLPAGWRKAATWTVQIEMYDYARGRYMTVSGHEWTP